VIEGKTFRNMPWQGAGTNNAHVAVELHGCSDMLIRACDFISVAEAVYLYDCEDITIEWARFDGILGPNRRDGDNKGNFVQANGCSRIIVRQNKGKGGDTEDVISVFASSDCVIEDNAIDLSGWLSDSGSGIALGDGSGSRNIARRNKLLNPGQVGIFIAGGQGSTIEDNVIYSDGKQAGGSGDVGVYVWDQYNSACQGHTVQRNKVDWKKNSGAKSGFWNGGNCGAIAGLSTNEWDAVVDPASLAVIL